MELRHLRYFIAVADHLNFSKAAASLHVSQPALSRQIRDLEEELGCRLFKRQSGQVALTEGGSLLLERARKIANDVAALPEVVRAGASVESRVLKLGHFGTFLALYLTPFLQRLRERRPGLRIEMVEVLPADALKMIRDGELGAALSGDPGPARMRGLRHALMRREQPTVVLRSGHPLVKKRRVKLADLAGENWAIWDERKFPSFGRGVEEACRRAGFNPKVVAVVDDMLAVYTGVAGGEFVGYMGSLTGPHRPPGVGTVRLEPGSIELDTLLIWSPESRVADDAAALGVMLEAAAHEAWRSPPNGSSQPATSAGRD